jgi:hypothetical protein
VVTGGWDSPAYEQEFVHYAGPLAQDDTRGYRDLLDVVFSELALDLPGLYGPVGLVPLFPMPAAVLRELVEALNDKELESAWGDDTTLGWIYQYWNDPEREALDAKINDGGKIEPHEIASKTQMFTERYMVEWLLQNRRGRGGARRAHAHPRRARGRVEVLRAPAHPRRCHCQSAELAARLEVARPCVRVWSLSGDCFWLAHRAVR